MTDKGTIPAGCIAKKGHAWLHITKHANSMHSLDILPLVQKDNNLQKEFGLESVQLPDQLAISTIDEENTTFVFRIFCLGLFSFYLLYIPANLSWLHPFYEGILPRKHSLAGYLQIVMNNSSRKKGQTNVTLQLKLRESQQVLFNGMCACTVYWFWVCTDSSLLSYRFRQVTKPAPNFLIYSGFMLKPL